MSESLSFPSSKGWKHTHNQLEEIAIAVPFALTCSGRISVERSQRSLPWALRKAVLPGTYTQGMQFALAPKMNIYVKNQVTLADAVACFRS